MIASSLVASVTVTVTAVVVVYTEVRCPNCNRRVLDIPGNPLLDVRAHRSPTDRLGRGVVCKCDRCKALVEAIVRPAA